MLHSSALFVLFPFNCELLSLFLAFYSLIKQSY
uniref:Uncharacterized protein n=1 Tax=Rhizophora mucronata TaxID=61149 RepID=A0A2P2NQH2_RHIMU